MKLRTVRPLVRDIMELDKLLHERARLAILTLLAIRGKVEYRYLQLITGMSSGALSSHLYKLEEEGIVNVNRKEVGRRSLIEVSLTREGERRFKRYLQTLRKLTEVVLEATS